MKWTQWRLLEEESGEACLEPQQLVSSVSQSAWGCGLLVSHKCACSIKQNVSGPTTCEVHRCILSSTTVLMRHRNAGVSSPPAKEADFQVLCHWKQLWAPWFRLHEGSTYRQEHFLDEQSAGEFSQHLRDPSRGSCLFLFPGSQRMFLPFKCAPGKFSIKPGWHRPALHQQWLQSLSSRVVVDQLAGRAQDGLAGPWTEWGRHLPWRDYTPLAQGMEPVTSWLPQLPVDPTFLFLRFRPWARTLFSLLSLNDLRHSTSGSQFLPPSWRFLPSMCTTYSSTMFFRQHYHFSKVARIWPFCGPVSIV